MNGTSDYLTASWGSGGASRVDEAYYETVNYSTHAARLHGAFVAPETGHFHFYLKARATAVLNITDEQGNQLVSKCAVMCL